MDRPITTKDYSHLLPPEHQQHFKLKVTLFPSNMYEGATQHEAFLQTPQGTVAGSRHAITHPEKRGLIMNYYTTHGAPSASPAGGQYSLGDEAHLASHAAHPLMRAVVERAMREHLTSHGINPAAQQLGGNWNDADALFGRPYAHLNKPAIQSIDGGGQTTPPAKPDLKVIKAGENDAGEPLEKRSKNVREKIRSASPETQHQRMLRYIRSRGIRTQQTQERNSFGTGEKGPFVRYDSYTEPEHELGHAMMTPMGLNLNDQQRIADSRTLEDPEHDDLIATQIQHGLARRAGIQPRSTTINARADLRNPRSRLNSPAYDGYRDELKAVIDRAPEATREAQGILGEYDAGVRRINPSGNVEAGTSVNAKINTRAMRKNMDEKDDKKLAPPQWLGHPIVDHGHVQDLETRAAMNEFGHKMPRHEAEQAAHDSYVKDQRERAAAHHLAGMKAAMATGNHEDAKKHWALYDLHLKALGGQSIGPVPPEVEKRMMEAGEKPLYRFKAHKGDMYALHEPSKDQAPPAGVPIQKGEVIPFRSKKDRELITADMLGDAEVPNRELAPGYRNGEERVYQCDQCGHRANVWADPGKHEPFQEPCESCGKQATWKPLLSIVKAETKQCKWKLGERRCKRMVTTDYCHDHVDHWANKIRQREAAATPEIAKADLPPAGTGQLASPPAPAAPQLHNTVEGFVGGLKALPKGSPERGKYLTAHMSHAPFIAALSQHPQGKQVHAMIMQHLNSPANAGFKPGATKVVAKAEAVESAQKLLKAVAALAKGKLLEFPQARVSPAVDQGQPAQVQSIVPPLADCPQCIAAAHNVLQGGGKLEDAIGPQSAAIFRQKHALADPSPYRQGAQNQRIETHRALTALIHARHGFKK